MLFPSLDKYILSSLLVKHILVFIMFLRGDTVLMTESQNSDLCAIDKSSHMFEKNPFFGVYY